MGRREHALVYDAARGLTLLFGGYYGSYLNDMWSYDGNTWRQLTPATLPSARSRAAIAYDAFRQKVVLMGGTDGTTLTDTWEWDGTNWTRVSTGQNQLAPGGAAAFDPGLGGVLFNLNSVNLLWNGSTWNSLAVNAPNGGQDHVLVYDPTSAGIMTQVGQRTRRFQKSAGWQDVLTSFSFSRTEYAMAIDPTTGRIALSGGSSNIASTETAIWLGSSWWLVANYNVGPAQAKRGAMVFDLARRVFVNFGGFDGSSNYYGDTWELGEVVLPAASYDVFGAGCSGTFPKAPRLQADALLGPRPILGGALVLGIDNLPSNQPMTGWLGSSSTSWGSLPLPLDLSGLGMPGCQLYVSPDLSVPLGTSSATGVGTWYLPVPNTPALAGQRFFQQVAILAPTANLLGALWSNAGAGKVGGR